MPVIEEEISTQSAPHTLTSQQRREICNTLIEAKIRSGFAKELHMQDQEYSDSFAPTIKAIAEAFPGTDGQLLALVETRIPFKRQLELLGVDLDPAVFYGVKLPQTGPYAVFLKVVTTKEAPFTRGANYIEAAESLPDNLKPASPLEGINADFQAILAQSFVILSGGEYDKQGILTGGSTRFGALCLERHLGRSRISHINLAKQDALVGMLAFYN